ncbi:ATP-binding protein [Cellulomonas sp.]|uniref:ATP-binding protein n=1 Tax=Cellulomonas sp. TaxID=40001 RepID=UPI002D6F2A35|nr:helix-turn-helix domain-containing protein [Cellulomonas sp.]HYQ76930.1 helix-turn-helix domain-containing protein [Cellulomonas sp.]
MDDDLGALLRRHRQDADLTIEDLAGASGVSDRGIGDIERGVSRGPQHRTVEALADALRLRPDDRAVLLRLAREGRRRPAGAVPHALPLPRRVPDFTGRAAERAALGRVLRGEGAVARGEHAPDPTPPVAVVTGPPGFGKTTLAAQVARDLGEHFPERLFLDLRGVDHEPVTPDAAVRRVAEALASGTVPPDPGAASAHVRGLLAERRVLLVLDNAASEDQVRPLVPADGPSAVLVTSRRALAGLDGVQQRTVLGRLAPGDSVGLLDAILPGRGSAEDLARLARLCDDVPLALRIAGNRLAARAGWSIDGLVRRMAADERRLDALAAGDLRVRAAFTSSYEQLGPGAQRLFRRLALVDAPTAGAGLAAALVDESVWRTEDLLDELVDLSLVQHLPGDRYGLHDLLRLYARSELEHQEDAAAHAAARAAADDWLLRTTVRAGYRFEPDHAHEGAAPGERDVDLPDQEAAQAWLRAEAPSWLAALRRAAAAGDHARVAEVADALHWFSDLWATWDRWAEVFDLSADAAAALGDDRLIAVHEGYRAWAQSICRGDLDRARAAADRALAAARRCGDTTQEGWALSYRSWIASQAGDLAAAEQDASAAVDCMLAAGDQEGAPQAMLSLAKARQRLGRLDEAAETVRATIARVADPRTRPRAQVAPFTEANAHVYLAAILVEAERWDEARAVASEALRLAAPLGVPRIVATAHLARGRAHAALGNTDAAVVDIEIAVAERRELGIDAPLAAALAALEQVRAAAVGVPPAAAGVPAREPEPVVAG